jgi:hypothetical protein
VVLIRRTWIERRSSGCSFTKNANGCGHSVGCDCTKRQCEGCASKEVNCTCVREYFDISKNYLYTCRFSDIIFLERVMFGRFDTFSSFESVREQSETDKRGIHGRRRNIRIFRLFFTLIDGGNTIRWRDSICTSNAFSVKGKRG